MKLPVFIKKWAIRNNIIQPVTIMEKIWWLQNTIINPYAPGLQVGKIDVIHDDVASYVDKLINITDIDYTVVKWNTVGSTPLPVSMRLDVWCAGNGNSGYKEQYSTPNDVLQIFITGVEHAINVLDKLSSIKDKDITIIHNAKVMTNYIRNVVNIIDKIYYLQRMYGNR